MRSFLEIFSLLSKQKWKSVVNDDEEDYLSRSVSVSVSELLPSNLKLGEFCFSPQPFLNASCELVAMFPSFFAKRHDRASPFFRSGNRQSLFVSFVSSKVPSVSVPRGVQTKTTHAFANEAFRVFS